MAIEDMKRIVLTIAGSDPSGGAGIQADIKTIDRLGGYPMSVITAITSQNTHGVQDILPTPDDHLASQLKALEDDGFAIHAVKTGMLPTVASIRLVADFIARVGVKDVVVDPVLQATSGTKMNEGRVDAYIEYLFPKATCITPNLPELEQFTGRSPKTLSEMIDCEVDALSLSSQAVLIKGGHMSHSEIADVLFDGKETTVMRHPKVESTNLHGTGCVLSAAIATKLSEGLSIKAAVQQADSFLQTAIEDSRERTFGNGNGPVLQ